MNDRNEGAANGPERAVYIISVAAELAGVHPQTLRIYEQKGLVRPHRTRGNTRRYSGSSGTGGGTSASSATTGSWTCWA